MNIHTISNELERSILVQDLKTERDSDEDGGIKTRVEFDSDFSYETDESDHQGGDVEVLPPTTDWHSVLDKQRPKGNTGPKGVKADYEQAKRITRRRNETKALEEREAFKRIVYGVTRTDAVEETNNTNGTSGSFVKTYDADEEDEDDDDDEFLQAYRMQRMQQVLQASQLPQFGRLKPVDRFEFLDEVDKADPRTYVVIHMYEEYINNCKRMNDMLERIARRHSHVKFLKLLATEADQELTHTALPAFLVYKQGRLINEPGVNVVITEFDKNDKFTEADVEWLLAAKYGIDLPGVDISQKELAPDAHKATEDSAAAKADNMEKNTSYFGRIDFRAKSQIVEDDDDDFFN